MQNLCFECNEQSTVNHHVIPVSLGGTKTVPLCNKCHSLVHQSKLHSSSELISLGHKRSKDLRTIKKVLDLYEQGTCKTEISKLTNISRNSIYKILRKANKIESNQGKGCNFWIDSKVINEIIRLRMEKLSWSIIEKKIGISHTHLFRLLRRHNLKDGNYYDKRHPFRQQYKIMDEIKINEAKKIRTEEKLTWGEIAGRIGVSKDTLYSHGIPQQFKPLNEPITDEKKKLVLEMRKLGRSWTEITCELGISTTSIYRYNLHK